jgi:hypothetical protein
LFCQRTNKQTNKQSLSTWLQNYTETCKKIIAQANKQKAEYQGLMKAKFFVEKMTKERRQDKYVVLENCTKQYVKSKGKPPEISNQELTQLLQDLSELN